MNLLVSSFWYLNPCFFSHYDLYKQSYSISVFDKQINAKDACYP